TRAQAAAGADVIVNINASPFHIGKSRFREQMLVTKARGNGGVVTPTNNVGGEGELGFDGNSVIGGQAGEGVGRGKKFFEDLVSADLNVEALVRARIARGRKKNLSGKGTAVVDRVALKLPAAKTKRARLVPSLVAPLGELEEVYRALVLGVKDYVRKNGFK